MNDEVKVEMYSKAENEALARVVIAAFMTRLNPTLEEISDVKTAVSEAVTNSIVHGYGDEMGKIILEGKIDGDLLQVSIVDSGIGIENVKRAREPLFTTKPEEERSGMGFTFMEIFMDEVHIDSKRNEGTTVRMLKKIVGGEK
ncbi:MAG: anti-sigma F factor [Lachnospiraceae bacterium]|nr:anti-sigma F factor [Lachnospiraceae bacterium]